MTTNSILLEVHRNPHYRRLCFSIARADLAEDLYHEFLLTLLSHPNLQEIYPKEWFNYFCIRVIKNLYTSRTSVFYKKYRHLDKTTGHIPDQPVFIPDFDEVSPETIPVPGTERIYDCLNLELDKMQWYDRELFRTWLYMRSARELSRKTRISQRSIARTLNTVRERLRNSKPCHDCLARES